MFDRVGTSTDLTHRRTEHWISKTAKNTKDISTVYLSMQRRMDKVDMNLVEFDKTRVTQGQIASTFRLVEKYLLTGRRTVREHDDIPVEIGGDESEDDDTNTNQNVNGPRRQLSPPIDEPRCFPSSCSRRGLVFGLQTIGAQEDNDLFVMVGSNNIVYVNRDVNVKNIRHRSWYVGVQLVWRHETLFLKHDLFSFLTASLLLSIDDTTTKGNDAKGLYSVEALPGDEYYPVSYEKDLFFERLFQPLTELERPAMVLSGCKYGGSIVEGLREFSLTGGVLHRGQRLTQMKFQNHVCGVAKKLFQDPNSARPGTWIPHVEVIDGILFIVTGNKHFTMQRQQKLLRQLTTTYVPWYLSGPHGHRFIQRLRGKGILPSCFTDDVISEFHKELDSRV